MTKWLYYNCNFIGTWSCKSYVVRKGLLVGSTIRKVSCLSDDISQCPYCWLGNNKEVSFNLLCNRNIVVYYYNILSLYLILLLHNVFIFHFSLPHWRGSVILVVTALKTFRSSFSDCSKQYLVLMLTILLFQYDPGTGFINGGVGINESTSGKVCL